MPGPSGAVSQTVGAIDDTSALRPPPMQPMSTPYQQVKEQDSDSPAYECAFHRDQKARWWMVESLLGGTEAMRMAGERYLPRYEKETHQSWLHRLQRATLLNYFRKTVMGYVGKPFGSPLKIPDDFPQHLRDFAQDCDGAGSPLDLFALSAFTGGVSKGICHVLVDFPTGEQDDTALEDATRKPYAVVIAPEALIGARSETIGGKEVLTQVRIMQIEVVPDGEFGEILKPSIRVIYRDRWEIWTKMPKRKDKWEIARSGPNTLGEIPLVTFYADKEGFMRSRPPLLDLAHVNVAHFQSASDQRNILSVTRFPILVATGINPKSSTDANPRGASNLEIGPNSLWTLRNEKANLKFVEHSGNAISAGRQDLEDLKAEMAILGLQLLMPANSGNPTATAKALDGMEAISELQSIVMNFEIFLNQILRLVDKWSDVSDEEAQKTGKVKCDEDYIISLNIVNNMTTLLAMRSSGDLSRRALLDAAKRRGYLPETFDIDDDATEREAEQKLSGALMLPGQKGKPPKLGEGLPPPNPRSGTKQISGKSGGPGSTIPTSPDRPTPA